MLARDGHSGMFDSLCSFVISIAIAWAARAHGLNWLFHCPELEAVASIAIRQTKMRTRGISFWGMSRACQSHPRRGHA